jgi:hypothetical protein
MTTYTVKATIEVDITNPSALNAIAGMTGNTGDERSKVQSAIDAGLKELPGIGSRYGFAVKSASATVE